MSKLSRDHAIRSVELWARDLALLRDLFESRVMTLDHVAALHFDGRREAAKKRIQKLKSCGVIRERPRRPTDPSVLFLAKEGLAILRERGILAEYPKFSMTALEKRAQVSELTLRHELEVMSVKAALVSAIKRTDPFSVAEFSTWPLLNQFSVSQSALDPRKSGTIIVKPDGFIRIHEAETDGGASEHTFYLELDRSTESQRILAERARAYLEHYRSGGLAERHGRLRSEYRDFPFRVLMILQNTDRRHNTLEKLLSNKPPTLTQVWLTTFEEITTDPLGSIWVRPKDYRDSVVDHSVQKRILFEE